MPARDSIAKEILQTEESYVAALSTVVNFFVAPLKQAVEHKKTIISSEEIVKIFSNLELLLGINQELLANLRDRIGVNWSDAQCIGSLFIELSPFLKNYAQYCNVFTESNQFLLECMENNPKFKRFLRKQQKRPECKSLDLESFLIMPVQRVPRYVLLLKDFLRHTDVAHPDHSPLTQALAQVELVAASINKSLSIYQNRAKLVFIEQELNIQIGLVQPHRELLREGTIQRVSCRKPGSVKIYVLNDMIILSEDGLYLDRSAIQVVYLMDGEPEHPFSFKLYCPTATSSTEFVFAASSEEERQEWWTFIENTINAYLRVKPSALLQRDKLLQKLEAKRSEEASMSPVERRRKQREEKKQDKKVKLTRDDSKFQTIRF